MVLPPGGEVPQEPPLRPSALRVTEASETRERRCADCGTMTATWKPVRRKGVAVILCLECAARTPPSGEAGAACAACGEPLTFGDAFCGKCGARAENVCPTCHGTLDPGDVFCGRCGMKVL